MIKNDIKLFFKLLRYGYERKLMLGFSVVVIILGMINCVIKDGYNNMLGVLLIMMAPQFMIQTFMGFWYPNFCQSSPKAKKWQTSSLATLSVLISTSGYLFGLVVILILGAFGLTDLTGMGIKFIAMSLFIAMAMLFYTFAYRSFWISMVIFCAVVSLPFIIVFTISSYLHIPMVVGILVGCAILLINWFPISLVAKLTYKYPMDHFALGVGAKEIK